VDVTSDALFWITPDARFVDVNPAACGSLGYTRDELLQLRIPDIDAEFDEETWQRHFTGLRQHGSFTFESKHRTRDGRLFPVEIVCNYVQVGADERGCAFVRDITARKRAQEALRRSEVQLQCILGSTADGILAVDRDGNVIRTNQRFAELWRIPNALLERKDGQVLLDHVSGQLDDPAAFLNKVHALHQSDVQDMDTLTFKDGRIFECFTSPLVLNGAILGRVWSFRDVTARARSEQALRKSEARFRSLTELSSDWYWEQDAQFRFTSLVGSVSAITGIRIEEHLGKTRWDMPAVNLSQADWAGHRALLERHEPFYGFEIQRPDAEGRPHWATTSGQPLFDDAGRFEGYRGVGSDITQRKLAEQALANINTELDARVKSRTAELEHANEALQRSNMELQRFAYVASHDLKTPLRSISSFAQLLQQYLRGKLDAQADDWMRRIVASSQRMDRMLQDALSYTQIDSRAQPFERVELSEACRAALG
jgi:PAS domain S-box-containing protein